MFVKHPLALPGAAKNHYWTLCYCFVTWDMFPGLDGNMGFFVSYCYTVSKLMAATSHALPTYSAIIFLMPHNLQIMQ